MKLEQVSVSRFRSVQNAQLAACGPFNVLIGKNNSGKSSLLSAVNTFFSCIADAQIIALDPPFGDVIDFNGRNTSLPIDIQLKFSLQPSEHGELIRDIAVEAPQMKNAIDTIESGLWFSATLSITATPVRFGFISRLALVSPDGSAPERTLFAVDGPSASELQMKYRNTRRAKLDADRLTDAAKNIDEDDYRRIRDGGSIPRGYYLRGLAEVAASTVQSFESLLRESSNYKEFRRLVSATAEKALEEARASQSEPLKNPVETFAGRASEIPKYVHSVMQALAAIKVLYLNERRKPLGKEEAQRLLELKVRRGGNEALRNIQETVQALLGVRIDAFESVNPSPRGKNAEMDVDDFLLEVNGAGIREALRLVLDYEFNRPNILLVEEPEVHLHPALEFAMMRYLKRVSQACQVFLSTHSTNFLDAGEMTNVYLVSKNQDTTVQLLNLEDAQARIPKELGLRLSSLFMFDRLVFVEGPSDEAVLRDFANKLEVNFAQWNVGFIAMGGVRNFSHFASEAILSFLSKRQVNIWFVLDHDENDDSDVERMRARLNGRASLHVLKKRELENYLLSPNAVSAFVREKLASATKQGADSSPEGIRSILDQCAEQLKNFAIVKRVAKTMCRPTFTSRFTAADFEGDGKAKVTEKLEEQLKELTSRRDNIEDAFARETAVLERDWADLKQDLVPGPELLDLVFQRFGLRFRKETDSSRLAAYVALGEIDQEIRELLHSIVR